MFMFQTHLSVRPQYFSLCHLTILFIISAPEIDSCGWASVTTLKGRLLFSILISFASFCLFLETNLGEWFDCQFQPLDKICYVSRISYNNSVTWKYSFMQIIKVSQTCGVYIRLLKMASYLLPYFILLMSAEVRIFNPRWLECDTVETLR